MKIKLLAPGLVLAACLLPRPGFTADNAPAPSSVPASANETATTTVPKDRHATSSLRSKHPVDDSVITTKIKGKFIQDKQLRADNIEIKTENGAVELFGTARTKAKAAHAVALARQVKGVKSVKNSIQLTSSDTARADDKRADKDRGANKHGSSQPVDDTWITTKVKALFIENKQVSATDIHVVTVNGVVELTGNAKSTGASSKAAALARGVKGVKSVTNNIKVI